MTHEDYRERIDAARRLLEERLDDDVPLNEVARAAHLSVFHFHRLFRGLTGETVREHVRRLRLERAAHHLTRSDRDVLDLALDAGYASHEAFTRAFKRRFGVAPSVFRQERREVIAATWPSEELDVDVQIKKRDGAHVAFVRHVGPYNEVGEAWKDLMKWGWSKMMFGKPETFALCHDDPEVTPPEQVRYDACMVVDEKTKPKGAVQMRDIPGGTYAVCVHEGSYEGIGRTYAALCAAVADGPIGGRRWQLAEPPSIETYLNDPRKTKPEDLRTEVWMPVTPA